MAGNVSQELQDKVHEALFTHEFMGMPALEKKTGLNSAQLNRVLRVLILDGWVSYEKKGRLAKYKGHKTPIKSPMLPLRGSPNKDLNGTARKVHIQSSFKLMLPGHRPIEMSRLDAKAIYESLHEEFGE